MSDKKYIQHPCFGKVTIGKPSGIAIPLFGSEAKHLSCVSVTVETAELVQDVHGDSVFGRKRVVEFWVSEAQGAHMLASFWRWIGNSSYFTLDSGNWIYLGFPKTSYGSRYSERQSRFSGKRACAENGRK